ncbi:MAG: endo-1,4-beta-xylanase [Candidatus Ornithomonoglobus sp.]
MKKRFAAALLVIAMAAGSMPVMPAFAAQGVELLNFDYDDTLYFEPSGEGKISLCDNDGHSGTRSIKLTGRIAVDDGVKLGVELAGESTVYNVTVWAKSQTGQKLTAELGDKKINSARLPAGVWTKLEGSVTLDGSDAELVIYGLDGTGDFLIDDVTVLAEGQVITTPYAPEGVNMFSDGDFESGGAGRFDARTSTVDITAEAAHSGKFGASVSGRTSDWNGIETNIKDLVIQKANYEASAWVKINSAESVKADYYLQLELASEGQSTEYPSVMRFTASSDEWTQVKGVFSTEGFAFPIAKLKLYIGSADGNVLDFYVDDFTFSYTKEPPSGGARQTNANPWLNTELTPLKDVYKDSFLLGTARSSSTGEAGQLEDAMIARHFDILTFGNDMKPSYLENKKGIFTFSKADTMIENTLNNGLLMHGHVLVWHQQSPSWLNEGLGREEALANLKEYITDVMGHFKGKCYSWDVVNEAISNITDSSKVSGILGDTPWHRAIGDDFIEQAFRFAHEADPDAKLYYNDFNLDDATKADAVVTLVKDLQSKGVQIDGIGMQGHYSVNTSIKAVENSIKKFAELGVKLSITELDVTCMQAGDVPTQAEYVKQAQKYAELFRLFKQYSDVIERVTLWGFDDATSWRAESYPCVFDGDYQPKEAYYALLDPDKYLEEHPLTSNVVKRLGAAYGTPVIDGDIDASWENVPSAKLDRYVMAWQGATGTVRAQWDEDTLYLIYNITDPLLSAVAADDYMQDSIEVFVDENNAKTTYYEEDDAQFRVSCENNHSFGTNGTEDRIKSAVKKVDGGYVVEAAIKFNSPKKAGDVIGFDAQVNDDGAGDGNRTSIAKFNDITDLSWGNTENWGELELSMDGSVTGGEEPEAAAEQTEDEIKVILNGSALTFDVPPVIMNERTLVPFRKLFEELGAEVEYIGDGRYVNAVKGETSISLQIDNTSVTVNGAEQTLDAAPVIIDDRTLVPLRFAAECLDAEVDWNGDTRTITINTK